MGYKLLLADDSITIQKVVGIIFANEDYELTVVDNGSAALEKASELLPDIILVDALMPGKTGYEVCREVRLDPNLKETPLLLLVGAFEPFDEEKARDCGADDYIPKPFESQQLIEKVKKLIELGKERAAAQFQVEAPQEAAPVAESIMLVEEMGVRIGSEAPQPFVLSDTAAAVTAEPVESPDTSMMDIVEAVPEDDLWGAFAAEEVTEGEDIQFGEIIEEEELQPEIVDTVEEIEPYVFVEEEPSLTGEALSIQEEFPVAGQEEDAVMDEAFVFTEESENGEFGGVAIAEPAMETAGDSFVLTDDELLDEMPESAHSVAEFSEVVPEMTEETYSSAPFMQAAPDVQFAPDEEYVPAFGTLSSGSDATASGIAETATADQPGISEVQLEMLISRISRDIIEKIAWEVVPDLAEAIIREEIRKIKEGY